jgi:hypothetical protein
MSLPQLPLDCLNKEANIHLVSLIPSGVDEADVMEIISTDIKQMVRCGLNNAWIASGPQLADGYRSDIRVLLAFLKGDTPQRASYTCTVGASGWRPCHACESERSSITDSQTISFRRRSSKQFERIQEEYQKAKSSKDPHDMRKATGYAITSRAVRLHNQRICHTSI